MMVDYKFEFQSWSVLIVKIPIYGFICVGGALCCIFQRAGSVIFFCFLTGSNLLHLGWGRGLLVHARIQKVLSEGSKFDKFFS